MANELTELAHNDEQLVSIAVSTNVAKSSTALGLNLVAASIGVYLQSTLAGYPASNLRC